MSNFLFYLLAFVVVIGVLVTVHEFGHYLAARWCGVKVLRFSFGFGPVIYLRKMGRDGTEWSVSAIPLGGYVRMLDEREAPVGEQERHRAFNRQSVGRRSLIVAAGPVANFFLAIVLYWFCFMTGSMEIRPRLGEAPAGSPASLAGVMAGYEVQAVDGEAVASWDDLLWTLLNKAADQESVELEVRGETRELHRLRLPLLAISEAGWESDGIARLGLRLYRPRIPAVVGKLVDGKPAQRAGLQLGDRILAVNEEETPEWPDFVRMISASTNGEVVLVVDRGGQVLRIPMLPEIVLERGERVGKVGVGVAEPPGIGEMRIFVRYGPVAAATRALAETWGKSVFTLRMFGRMLLGEVSLKNISGPVTIADYAGQTARLGLDYYLRFMAAISISLGVLNLLPVPVLDGGHLMYHMLEVVRRRPLSERAMELGQRIGLAMLVVLMAFAFFNDMNRLLAG